MPVGVQIVVREMVGYKEVARIGNPGTDPMNPAMNPRTALEAVNKAGYKGEGTMLRFVNDSLQVITVEPIQCEYVENPRGLGQGELPRDFGKYRRMMNWD